MTFSSMCEILSLAIKHIHALPGISPIIRKLNDIPCTSASRANKRSILEASEFCPSRLRRWFTACTKALFPRRPGRTGDGYKHVNETECPFRFVSVKRTSVSVSFQRFTAVSILSDLENNIIFLHPLSTILWAKLAM